MNTTSATRTGDWQRPLFSRVARKWYSWACLGLTVIAAYLALDGQLKLGVSSQLLAAPPAATGSESNVLWMASPSGRSTANAADTSAGAQADAPKPPGDVSVRAVNADQVEVPHPLPPERHRLHSSGASKVLKAYMAAGEVRQAKNEEAAEQDGPKITIPDLPDEKTPKADEKTPKLNEKAPRAVEKAPKVNEKTPRDDDKTPKPEIKAPAEPVEIIKPTPVKPAPPAEKPAPPAEKPVPPAEKPASPVNVPLPLPPKKNEAPALLGADEKAPKTDKQPAPAPKGELPAPRPVKPGPRNLDDSLNDPETIPTAPTPEGSGGPPDSLGKGLSAEVATLRTNERLIYDGALIETKLKNFPVAIERFEQLLRMRPDLLFVREQFAGILITANELPKAIEQLKRLVQHSPREIPFRIRLGDAYVINKQFRDAVSQFTEALRLAPNEPEYAVRLARAYAFDDDQTRANEIFERYLSQFKPDDAKAPDALGALLLDLDRPTEALPYLIAKKRQLERNPRGNILIEILANLVRAYARVGERGQAMEMLNEMQAKAPENTDVRIVLGETLLGIDEFELAGQVFNQVLQADPKNGPALIGLARVHLEMFCPANARRILDSFTPAVANRRSYLLTYAVYHERIGEWIEAKQIYKDLLQRVPTDHEVRFALGALLAYMLEFEKAKAEYAKIPPGGALGKRSRLNFAQCLFEQRRFPEAAEVAMVLVREDPNNALAIAAATRYLAKSGKLVQAVELARGYLSTNPKSEGKPLVVRLALARALLDGARNLEAAREYEIALSRPSGRVVAAFYGLARANDKLGNPQRVAQLLACVTGLPGGDVRNRMMLADLFNADFEDMKVIELCQAVAHGDPMNLSVLVRLADAQQRQSRWSGNPADCFDTCLRILKLSPTNVRGHMAMARAFAVAQNFRKSAAAYDNIIVIDPDFVRPALERAWVLYSDKQYSAARSQYDSLLQITPDDVVINQMHTIMQNDPKLRLMLAPYASGKIGGPMLRQELGRLATSPDEDLRLAAQRMVADYDATTAVMEETKLERDAKELKDYRRYEAIPAYEAVNAFDRANAGTRFDLAQNFGALYWTRHELDMYNEVLQIDPTYRDAVVASERANAEIGPKFDNNDSFFYQRGRNGLANIDRQKYTEAARLPLGDENEYVALGYTRAIYQGTDGPGTVGNIPFIRAQKRFDENHVLLYGQLNYETFSQYFHARPTFDTGGYYYATSWLTWHSGLYLENVAETNESMRQDIYRYGFYTGYDVQMTRTWNFGTEYKFGRYSDDNNWSQIYAYNENSLSLPPMQFKIVENMLFWGYRYASVFPTNPPNPNDVVGTIHPYFSPHSFLEAGVTAVWKHWLSRDYFVHSNQCWYQLEYGMSFDNQLNTYQNLRAAFNYDVCTWLTVGADTTAQLSSVYNMFSAMAYLQIRFR